MKFVWELFPIVLGVDNTSDDDEVFTSQAFQQRWIIDGLQEVTVLILQLPKK